MRGALSHVAAEDEEAQCVMGHGGHPSSGAEAPLDRVADFMVTLAGRDVKGFQMVRVSAREGRVRVENERYGTVYGSVPTEDPAGSV